MKCDKCDKESKWLEIVGKNFICHKCIGKNKVMGFIVKTNSATFKYLVQHLKIKDYEGLMKVTKADAEKIIDLKKNGIILK